jgi:SPX domain protein involved in polyphosphate accumulation
VWDSIVEFIIRYWIDILFGMLVTAGAFITKRMIKSFKRERQDWIDEQKTAFADDVQKKLDKIETASNNADCVLQTQIDVLREELEALRIGILSVQGDQFKKHCRSLLKPGVIIELEEFEELDEEYTAYKKLGGNHNGDTLYNQVVKKYEAQNQ